MKDRNLIVARENMRFLRRGYILVTHPKQHNQVRILDDTTGFASRFSLNFCRKQTSPKFHWTRNLILRRAIFYCIVARSVEQHVIIFAVVTALICWSAHCYRVF